MPYIESIACRNAEFVHQNQDILRFMAQVNQLDDHEQAWLNKLYNSTGIKTRSSFSSVFGKDDVEDSFINASLSQRMEIWKQEAMKLSSQTAVEAIANANRKATEFTHIITVSCTGLSAPGLEIELISALKLRPDIQRLAINFLGCYASLTAIRQALQILAAEPNALILVLSVELCTLHFAPSKDKVMMLSHSLFADGCGAVVLSNNEARGKVKLNNAKTYLLPAHKSTMMSWEIGERNFEMFLHKEVPSEINTGLSLLKGEFYQENLKDIDLWAIHPGGAAILSIIEKGFGANTGLECSKQVLAENGNMSSATILFILQKLMNDQSQGSGLALAFGPGLTIEALSFECYA